MPVTARYRPDPRHLDLGESFYDPVEAAAFPKHVLRFRNDRWAASVGLDGLGEAEWIDHFGRFAPLPDNLPQPLALRYHGHQFRVYNPDLGDGRGFLFAQMREGGEPEGRLLDLGTKGSGQTPWSRGADGRLTLKGGVREILATEMLEARGVPTSKSFSLIETGENLMRGDEPSPTRSAVLVRLSHGHIRIGSFQRLIALEDAAGLRRLADYVIETYWPGALEEADPIAGLYRRVVEAVAETGAAWHAAGFVHGVLNTDNIAITGESFDYGPWRFLERYDLNRVAAYFDHGGLYAYGRQAESLHWNLARLAECLVPLSDLERLEPIFRDFPRIFDRALARRTAFRLGLAMSDSGHDPGREPGGDDEAAVRLAGDFWTAMAADTPSFEQVFHDLLAGAPADRVAASPQADIYATGAWPDILARLRAADLRLDSEAARPGSPPESPPESPVDMPIGRVEDIWSAIDGADDWSMLEDAVADIRAAGRRLRSGG
ncbi:YdiU family protein [Marivibrio halodurans]|uniref:Protein nucleotidyltransferase YdiU n=1 Tax=Marivibrio halodurans TaxID=2039722 RepID=A0A8J7V3B9_9PROT|nr:YdiU family protein [Marivibrio halodurans]MBP5858071.1 YdiU family protein [Marivibrio halodurans]